MIIVKEKGNGKTEIEIAGTKDELFAEFTALVTSLKEEGFSESALKEALKIGLMDEKDANEYMANEVARKFMKMLEKAIETLKEENKEDE